MRFVIKGLRSSFRLIFCCSALIILVKFQSSMSFFRLLTHMIQTQKALHKWFQHKLRRGFSKSSLKTPWLKITVFHDYVLRTFSFVILFWECVDVSSTLGIHGERSSLAPQLALQPAIYLELIIADMDFTSRLMSIYTFSHTSVVWPFQPFPAGTLGYVVGTNMYTDFIQQPFQQNWTEIVLLLSWAISFFTTLF